MYRTGWHGSIVKKLYRTIHKMMENGSEWKNKYLLHEMGEGKYGMDDTPLFGGDSMEMIVILHKLYSSDNGTNIMMYGSQYKM